MPTLLLALVLSAEPAPTLKSLAGLNVPALKPWLIEQLPSLAQCVNPSVTEGDDEVSVQAQFGKSPEVSVMRVDGRLSDVACVRGVVDRWKRDKKQPSAGPFSFKYKFKPSKTQRAAVVSQAQRAFDTMCERLSKKLTVEVVKDAMVGLNPALPMGMQVSIEDAISEAETVEAAKVSLTLSKALRDIAETYGAEQCIR
jgi:hypothetical protein